MVRPEDLLVEVGARVNSALLVEVFDLSQHLLHILAVSLVVVAPFAASVRVIHQIKPKPLVVLLRNHQHDRVDLEFGTLSPAGPHEQLGAESGLLGEDKGVSDAEVEVDSFEGECSDV